MNTTQAVLVFLTVALAGVGPFIAVHRGGSAYEFDDEPESEPCTDDTIELSRVRARRDPDMR